MTTIAHEALRASLTMRSIETQRGILGRALEDADRELRLADVARWARPLSPTTQHLDDVQFGGLRCVPILLEPFDQAGRAPIMAVTFDHPSQWVDRVGAQIVASFGVEYDPESREGIVAAQLSKLLQLHQDGILPNYWPGNATIIGSPTQLPDTLFVE